MSLSPQGSFHHITEVEEHEKHANESQAGQHTQLIVACG